MNDLTPTQPPDPVFQLMDPMAKIPAPAAPKFRLQKLFFFLRKFWWIPLVTVALSIGAAITIFFQTPPTFVSTGSIWETEKLEVPGGAAFSEDRDNFLGTQADLLRNNKLREM